MSALCEKLDLFIDGELSEEDCEQVRCHLPRCPRCANDFREALQLEVLAAEALGGGSTLGLAPARKPVQEKEAPTPGACAGPAAVAARREAAPRAGRRRAGPRRRAVWGMGVAAALVALVYVSLPTAGPSAELWLAQAPTRRLEARLSISPLESHRPFVPMRSGGQEQPEPVPLRELARLDEQKDAVAIAAAFLVRGDAEQARGFLEAAPATPQRDNALAVVAMEQGELSEALRLLEGVLRTQPDHVQAQWNRALVLRDLGHKEQAAQAFEQLAARGEPGWSQEAAHNARSLRAQQAP